MHISTRDTDIGTLKRIPAFSFHSPPSEPLRKRSAKWLDGMEAPKGSWRTFAYNSTLARVRYKYRKRSVKFTMQLQAPIDQELALIASQLKGIARDSVDNQKVEDLERHLDRQVVWQMPDQLMESLRMKTRCSHCLRYGMTRFEMESHDENVVFWNSRWRLKCSVRFWRCARP